jgi:hypothetical protein
MTEQTENPQNRVWVNVERTLSNQSSPYLNNYESIKFIAGESRVINQDEDSFEVRDQLFNSCLNHIDQLVEEWKE